MPHMNEPDFSDTAELESLERISRTEFRITFDTTPVPEASHNMIGLRSKSILFSRRLDSRTYFVQDLRYGLGKPAGVFRGDDAEQIKLAREIMDKVGACSDEIHREPILTEKLGVGHLDRQTGAAHTEKVQEGRKVVSMSRHIGGLPVWSSSLLLGLTANKQIGFLQLHWPVIPENVMLEAQRIAFKVKNGWQPPEHRNAKVEMVEAGVVHSPAMGFFMDIHAAIRVIYASSCKLHSGRAMLYLNRHGQVVPLRRTTEMATAPQPKRKP
jgi:hypothetical protein